MSSMLSVQPRLTVAMKTVLSRRYLGIRLKEKGEKVRFYQQKAITDAIRQAKMK